MADVIESGVCVEIAGELLTLLGERGVWWRRRSTLFVADTHFGKAAACSCGWCAGSGGFDGW